MLKAFNVSATSAFAVFRANVSHSRNTCDTLTLKIAPAIFAETLGNLKNSTKLVTESSCCTLNSYMLAILMKHKGEAAFDVNICSKYHKNMSFCCKVIAGWGRSDTHAHMET